jgi:rubrerythrin
MLNSLHAILPWRLSAAVLHSRSFVANSADTLENLQAAFDGESNANARYLAFAQKAGKEGYGEVASLFRAVAKAEEFHARNHAAVIRQLGADLVAHIEHSKVRSTRENLQTVIEGEKVRARRDVSRIHRGRQATKGLGSDSPSL